MLNRAGHEATAKQVFLWAWVPAIVSWSLIPFAFVLPPVDSTRTPYFDLTNTISQIAYWVSKSGGKFGIPIIVVSMLTLLVTRRRITIQRRWKEACVVVLVAAICGGGGALLNGYILKEQFKVPRQNIVWLAGDNGSGPLGMSAKDFYEGGNRDFRSEILSKVLNEIPEPVPLSSAIKAHWIKETGYALPSGHSFSAMFFATFLLALGATYLTNKRIWIFYLLLPWALAVCYSRSILRVHTPADITFGGLMGLAVGLLAWAAARALIRKIAE